MAARRGESEPSSPTSAPYIKHHLHFMSLNCFCCPPPHRLHDFVPVTVHPLHPWRSCDRLRWTFCLHPPHCVPEIRKYYLPVGSRKKKKKKKKGGVQEVRVTLDGRGQDRGSFLGINGKSDCFKSLSLTPWRRSNDVWNPQTPIKH